MVLKRIACKILPIPVSRPAGLLTRSCPSSFSRPLHTSAPLRTGSRTKAELETQARADGRPRNAHRAPLGFLAAGGLVASFFALSQPAGKDDVKLSKRSPALSTP